MLYSSNIKYICGVLEANPHSYITYAWCKEAYNLTVSVSCTSCAYAYSPNEPLSYAYSPNKLHPLAYYMQNYMS